MLTLKQECYGADDHGDRADLHVGRARTLHLQQKGMPLLLTQRTRHPDEADDRQDEPDDEEEVEQVSHVRTTFHVGVVCL